MKSVPSHPPLRSFRHQRQRLSRHFLPILSGIVCCLLVLGIHHTLAFARTPSVNQARIIEILQSNQVYIQNRPARLNDVAKFGEQVRTGQARTALRFNTGAIGRLGQNAVITIGQQCLQVQRGQVLVNGAASSCTRSVVTGVRGTTYVLSVDDQGEEEIRVLEGEVAITPVSPNSRNLDRSRPLVVNGGRRVRVANGAIGPIQPLTPDEYDTTLNSTLFNEFRRDLPGVRRLRRSYEQLFPQRRFPLAPNPDRAASQGWDISLRLVRLTNSNRAQSPAISIQFDVFNKPVTRYANVVYQIYALNPNNNRWETLYSNVGARLIPNQAGTIDLPSEIVSVNQLNLRAIGKTPLENLRLQARANLRYDLQQGALDVRLNFVHTRPYREVPVAIGG
ncbi:MAG: hypothetical protein SFW36_16120 [Leptolyngbyaceae cyanobacterium bins.59]|nr:hypothetical protein [Leptolyngbyaceae cyanobacterium bins.59]